MFTLSISNVAYGTEDYLAKAVIPNLSHRYQPFSQTFDAKKANWSKNCDFRNPRNFHTSTQPYQKVKTLLRTKEYAYSISIVVRTLRERKLSVFCDLPNGVQRPMCPLKKVWTYKDNVLRRGICREKLWRHGNVIPQVNTVKICNNHDLVSVQIQDGGLSSDKKSTW